MLDRTNYCQTNYRGPSIGWRQRNAPPRPATGCWNRLILLYFCASSNNVPNLDIPSDGSRGPSTQGCMTCQYTYIKSAYTSVIWLCSWHDGLDVPKSSSLKGWRDGWTSHPWTRQEHYRNKHVRTHDQTKRNSARKNIPPQKQSSTKTTVRNLKRPTRGR